MTRRELYRRMAAAAAVSAAQALFPGIVFAATETPRGGADGLEWRKTPCRFCGVGCGLLVGLAKGRAVAVKGDPASPVNKGLCCVKGYHSVMALYGKDRLTRALVRKDGKLVPVPMKEALVAATMAETIKAHGKDAVAMYGSGQWTIPDGYVASKFMKGGIGTNNLEANARLCMASAVTGFMTSFGLDEPMGCYENIDHADVFVLWGNNMAEMHPVLFSRLLDHPRLRSRALGQDRSLLADLGGAHGDRGALGPRGLRVHGARQGRHRGRARPVAVARARRVARMTCVPRRAR